MNTPKIALPILVSIFFLGCDMLATPIVEYLEDEVFIEYPYLEEPLQSVWERSASFDCVKEAEGENYFKSPREFEKDGFGDCEDFSGWMIYHLGVGARCRAIQRYSDPPGSPDHSVVVYQGLVIDPQTYGMTYEPEEYRFVGEMSYDAVMKLSTLCFTK